MEYGMGMAIGQCDAVLQWINVIVVVIRFHTESNNLVQNSSIDDSSAINLCICRLKAQNKHDHFYITVRLLLKHQFIRMCNVLYRTH